MTTQWKPRKDELMPLVTTFSSAAKRHDLMSLQTVHFVMELRNHQSEILSYRIDMNPPFEGIDVVVNRATQLTEEELGVFNDLGGTPGPMTMKQVEMKEIGYAYPSEETMEKYRKEEAGEKKTGMARLWADLEKASK